MKQFKTFGLILFALLVVGCGRIETGHVGVRTTFNKEVVKEVVPQGFYVAVFESVDEYVIKEIEVKIDDLKPKAKDNLFLQDMDLSVFYETNPSKVAGLKIKYSGMDADHGWTYLPAYKLIKRNARSATYDAVAQHDSLTLHTKRNELQATLIKNIQGYLDASDPDTFTITKVIIRQMITDPALEESIQANVKIRKEIERVEQQSKLATAEAKRLRIEADGKAVANRIEAASLTPKLIEFRRIQMMAEFAQEGTHTVLLPQNSNVTPFINVGSVSRETVENVAVIEDEPIFTNEERAQARAAKDLVKEKVVSLFN